MSYGRLAIQVLPWCHLHLGAERTMPTTSLKLPEALKEKVATIAAEAEQTPHAYMVAAIAERVARDERRAHFVAAAEKSEAELRRRGTAYAHEDVWRYIRSRAAGKKGVRRPKALKVPRSER
jgi:predicted transcriptional regulator